MSTGEVNLIELENIMNNTTPISCTSSISNYIIREENDTDLYHYHGAFALLSGFDCLLDTVFEYAAKMLSEKRSKGQYSAVLAGY